MFERLRRVDRPGSATPGILVLVDRVDEPTLVNGDAEKMREIIWPLFNNKFLQQERFGIKLLLPIELRHALFKESADFFQEARLDKQGFIERLTWTGPMLYDLCNARLQRLPGARGAEPLSLIELFAEDVTRQDLVDALDQMHQPRDAFKFLYRCFNEHCSNVTAEEGEWRVPARAGECPPGRSPTACSSSTGASRRPEQQHARDQQGGQGPDEPGDGGEGLWALRVARREGEPAPERDADGQQRGAAPAEDGGCDGVPVWHGRLLRTEHSDH
jgi:hypothetical protein